MRLKRGRPRKIRVSKKARTKAFGKAVKGARTPAQIRASIKKEVSRPRSSWMNSKYRKRRYG